MPQCLGQWDGMRPLVGARDQPWLHEDTSFGLWLWCARRWTSASGELSDLERTSGRPNGGALLSSCLMVLENGHVVQANPVRIRTASIVS